MHCFSADTIYPVSSPPVPNGLVVTDDSGVILDILPAQSEGRFSEESGVRRFRGILCPGFINAHCHLELSHLKGKIPPGATLPGFILHLVKERTAPADEIAAAISSAEAAMVAQGIVGVGDICNTADTIEQKKKKNLSYYNFIELFDIDAERADEEFEKGLSLKKKFELAGIRASPVPHSPYTATPKLLKRINEYAYAHDGLLTIHNQETLSEDELFKSKSGALFEALLSMSRPYAGWIPTGYNALASTLVHLPRCNKILLVHNTYSAADDIRWALLYSPLVYWCFCPNANRYIENRLPDVQIFLDAGCRILIGTDSYASNTTLSILEELKTISLQFPKIPLQQLLAWATVNGADFFGWKNELGTLEKGKRPGINLITDVNTENQSLTATSEVKPLHISSTIFV